MINHYSTTWVNTINTFVKPMFFIIVIFFLLKTLKKNLKIIQKWLLFCYHVRYKMAPDCWKLHAKCKIFFFLNLKKNYS